MTPARQNDNFFRRKWREFIASQTSPVTSWHTKTGGGGGVLNKVLYWEAPTPRSNPLHFYIPFLTEKGTHFEYLLLINGTPFTNLNSLERCIPFNCCESLSLKHEKNHKASKFLRLFHSHINPSISLFKSVYRLDILQLMKSQPFHIAEA